MVTSAPTNEELAALLRELGARLGYIDKQRCDMAAARLTENGGAVPLPVPDDVTGAVMTRSAPPTLSDEARALAPAIQTTIRQFRARDSTR